MNVRRSSTDRRLDETFWRPHGSRSPDDTRRERRHLRFSWSKRGGEINHVEDVVGSGKAYLRRDQISGARFELGIPAGALAHRGNHRNTSVLRKFFGAQESATACFIIRRRPNEARGRGARNRRLARPCARSSEGLFVRHAATPRNCTGAFTNPGAYHPRRANQWSG